MQVNSDGWPAIRRNTKHMNTKIVIRSETDPDVSAIKGDALKILS
jgi:hypothetical protein